MSTDDFDISFTIIETKAQDLQSICRTCLCKNVNLLSIDSEVLDVPLNISSLLESCIALKVDNTDDLPKQVCSECLGELIKVHNFKNKCHQNENILKSMFKKKDSETKFIKSEPEESASDTNWEEQNRLEGGVDESFWNIVKLESDLENEVINVDDAGHATVSTNATVEIIDPDPIPEIYDNYLVRLIQLEHQYSHQNNESDERHINIKQENEELEELFKCKICRENFTSKEMLMKHAKGFKHSQSQVTKSKPKKKYTCEKCGTKFYRGTTLRRHIARHAGSKPHICDICGKGFTTAVCMNKHREVHNKNVHKTKATIEISPPYICKICSCEYKSLFHYKSHVSKKHKTTDSKSQDNNKQMKKSKDYHCDLCNKTFVSKLTLNHHRLVHGDKNFLCATCGTAFFSRQTLNNHLRIHNRERQFKCHICSRSFTMYSAYEEHMQIHTGNKPYICTVCNKFFLRRQHLSAHMKTHTGERLHQCTFCERSFAQKFNLTVHMRIHTGDKPYKCPECGKGFVDSGGRRRHCMNRHRLELKRIRIPVEPINKL